MREGDLLLAVDAVPVCTFRDVEVAVASKPSVSLTLLREEEVVVVDGVPTALLDGVGTSRIVVWAGLLLQTPYRQTREMGVAASEIYCSYFLYGSPAHYFGLKACRYVTAIAGKSVVTLDDLLEAVAGVKDGEAVQLKMVDLQGQAASFSLKVDYHYSPTCELTRNATGKVDWEMTAL